MRGAEFEGEYKTVEKFPLIIIPLQEDVSELHSHVPALYNKPGLGHQILGKIFSVDKEHLARLDEFEECPHLYMRTTVSLTPVNGAGAVRQAFAYFKTEIPEDIERRDLLSEYPLDGGYKPRNK
jgi:gamma-glutamylaminecyclotransferase